jgi:hypothetical protein
MSHDERVPYHNMAVAASRKRQQASTMRLGSSSSESLDLSSDQRKRISGLQAAISNKDCKSHPTWAAGLGLGSYAHALSPQLVDTDADDKTVGDFVTGQFLATDAIVENPLGKTPYETLCWTKHGGVCKRHPLLKAAEAMFYQVDALLKHWDHKRAGIMIRCSSSGGLVADFADFIARAGIMEPYYVGLGPMGRAQWAGLDGPGPMGRPVAGLSGLGPIVYVHVHIKKKYIYIYIIYIYIYIIYLISTYCFF